MTYKEYSNLLNAYNKAMSSKKSLEMTIRMNKAWITGDNERSNKRRVVIADCKAKLAALVIPAKPAKQYGFDVCTDEDCYFAPTTDEDNARLWAESELDCKFSIWPSSRQITTDHQGLVW